MKGIQEMKENIAHNRYMIGRVLNWHGILIDHLHDVEQRLVNLEGVNIKPEREKAVLIRIK